MELLINPLFRDALPALTNEESKGLEDDLVLNGCNNPIIIKAGTVNGVTGFVIVDGHNRYEKCKRLGIPFEVKELPELKNLSDEEIIQWIIKYQTSTIGRKWINHIEERDKHIAKAHQALAKTRKPKLDQYTIIGKQFNLSVESIRKILRNQKRENRNAQPAKSKKTGKEIPVEEYKTKQGIAINNVIDYSHTDLETNIHVNKMATELLNTTQTINQTSVELPYTVQVVNPVSSAVPNSTLEVTPTGYIETKNKVIPNECYATTRDEAIKKLNPYALTEKEAIEKLKTEGYIIYTGFKQATEI